jgi:hypothetical protein
LRHPDDLEAAREAVREPLAHEERRRSQQHDAERSARRGVLVPELLHDVRPIADLLHLVEDEQRSSPRPHARLLPTDRPLGVDPADVLRVRRISRGEVTRHADGVHHLPRERRLAYLTRAGEHLDELARLVGPLEDLRVDGPPIDACCAGHCSLL